MLIDWFTVGAQVLNFLVLVWLLKRFLYQPVLDAIDAREKKIADELARAANSEEKAEQDRQLFAQKNQQFDTEREQHMQQVRDQARAEGAQLLAQAREAAEALKTRQLAALDAEQSALANELARRTRAEVFALTRQAFAAMADSELEAQLLKVFIQRLQSADHVQEMLAQSGQSDSKDSPDSVLIASAFALSAAQQGMLRAEVKACLKQDVALQFEVDPALLAGIELTVGGYRLGWSLNSYLSGLQESTA